MKKKRYLSDKSMVIFGTMGFKLGKVQVPSERGDKHVNALACRFWDVIRCREVTEMKILWFLFAKSKEINTLAGKQNVTVSIAYIISVFISLILDNLVLMTVMCSIYSFVPQCSNLELAKSNLQTVAVLYRLQ